MNETPQPERKEVQDTNDDRAAGIDHTVGLCILQRGSAVRLRCCENAAPRTLRALLHQACL